MSKTNRLATSTMKTEAEADRRAFVTLRFAGDDLDPGEISAVLPIAPTRAHRKGEEFFAGPHAGKLRGRTGIWFLATDRLVPSDHLDDHFGFVEQLLYPKRGRTAGSGSSARSWSAHTPMPTSLAFGAGSAASLFQRFL